jgi:hypothetical protein
VTRGGRWLSALALVAAMATLAVYAASAVRLVAYPFEWSPDDGWLLDDARRLLNAPDTLYPRSFGPSPCPYTPLVPLLAAPLVAAGSEALALARVLMLACVATALAATAWLVGRRGGLALGLASAALLVAPLDLSFWLMLLRVDGPMLALWLLAAIPLLPERLARGADRLGPARLAWGTVLLILAVLAKPTAVLHGAPLVLGWLAVDWRSAWRLGAAVAGTGIAALALLQWLSRGGFLYALGLYGAHSADPRWIAVWSLDYVGRAGPVVLLALGCVWLGLRLGGGPARRESAWLLVLGGLVTLPGLAKLGAYWNYLLPLHAATVVLAGRMAAHATAGARRLRPLVAAGLALAALALASTRVFPLPSRQDAATAAAFLGFVEDTARAHPGPMLLLRSDYSAWRVGQPAVVEATDLRALAARRVPGVVRLIDGIAAGRYRLITGPAVFLPLGDPFPADLLRRYQLLGYCDLGYFFGRERSLVLAPVALGLRFAPPRQTRCHPAEGSR